MTGFFSVVKADDVAGFTLTADQKTVTENFDGMWDATTQEATLVMPAGWRVDRQMSAPRMVGAYSSGATEVMYTGGVSLASNAKNGTWNFGSSTDPSDRAIGGLSTTVDGGTRCVSVMTQLTNGGTEPINQLTISYDIEKYRKGDNAEGFTVQLYYSADGTSWKKAGDETGYDALGLYAWGDGELFGAWPGETWVDEKVIDGNTYKVFLLDAESGSYNLIFNNWNNGSQLDDYNITADRDYYFRLTSSGVEQVTVTGITPLTAYGLPLADAIYTLDGRKIVNGNLSNCKLPKGIYIVNGKKVVMGD